MINSALFFGLGRIGLPQSLVFAHAGVTVYGYDIDPQVVQSLNAGELPFFESDMNDLYSATWNKTFYPLTSWQEVLAKVDRKSLTVAMKGTSEQLRGQILGSMSQRGAEMLREDMEALGPVKIKDVEAAQQQIISIVRQLETEGVVSLKGTVGEQYVV